MKKAILYTVLAVMPLLFLSYVQLASISVFSSQAGRDCPVSVCQVSAIYENEAQSESAVRISFHKGLENVSVRILPGIPMMSVLFRMPHLFRHFSYDLRGTGYAVRSSFQGWSCCLRI